MDEIQYIEEWERFVNSHSQDFAEPIELFISGSNSNLLSGELATLLSGRYVEFEVFPFSYTEYCGITQQEKGSESYKKFLQSGALPELFNLPNDEMKQNYVSSIKDTVMLRDIVGRYNIKDCKAVRRLVYLFGKQCVKFDFDHKHHQLFASKKTEKQTTKLYRLTSTIWKTLS